MSDRNPIRSKDGQNGQKGGQRGEFEQASVLMLRDQVQELATEVDDLRGRVADLEEKQGDLRCSSCGARFYAEDSQAVHRKHGLVSGPGRVVAVECPECGQTNGENESGASETEMDKKVEGAKASGDGPQEKDASTGKMKSQQ